MGIMKVFDLSSSPETGPQDPTENNEVKVINEASTATAAATGEVETVASKQEAEKTVVMDGPLSQIYTQALNIAYAKEGLSTMVSFLEAKHDSLTSDEDLEENRLMSGNAVTADGTYVYCIDGTDLEGQGLVAATEALRVAKSKYKEVVLALESHGVVTSRVQLLGEMGEALGAKVCMTRDGAMDNILARVKR